MSSTCNISSVHKKSLIVKVCYHFEPLLRQRSNCPLTIQSTLTKTLALVALYFSKDIGLRAATTVNISKILTVVVIEYKENGNKNIIRIQISIVIDKVPIPQRYYKLGVRVLTSVDYTKQPSNTFVP
ncbi:MAG: hypothetical protein CMK29_04465 [Porticoccaceae bacterium]|nr:hypothetical protein [Porticoccaceae bacterium]